MDLRDLRGPVGAPAVRELAACLPGIACACQDLEPEPPVALKPLRGILRRSPPPAPIDTADELDAPKDGADTPSTAFSPTTSLDPFSPTDSFDTPRGAFSPQSASALLTMDSADAASPKTISRGLRRLLPAFAADALSPKGGASAPSPAHSPKWASQRCRWPEAASASGQLPRPPPPVARGPPRASQRAAPGHRLVSLCRAVGVVRAGAPIQGAGPTLGVPTVSGSTVGGVAGGRRGRTSALAEALAAAQTPLRKRVCFSHEIPDTLDVTPYSSHYGIHPNFFDFDRDGDMRLTFTGIAEVFRRKEAGLAPLEEDMQEFLNPACAAEF